VHYIAQLMRRRSQSDLYIVFKLYDLLSVPLPLNLWKYNMPPKTNGAPKARYKLTCLTCVSKVIIWDLLKDSMVIEEVGQC
jgi:hypothetical protein